MKAEGSRASHRPDVEVPYWHLVPFTIFILINTVIWSVWYRDLVKLKEIVTPFRVVLWGLAVYRIANIVSNEQVTRALRAPFIDQEQEGEGHIKEKPLSSGFKHTIGSLLYCPSCVGVWAAAFIVYLLVFAPVVGWVIVLIFALSAIERVLTNLVALLNAPIK